MLPKISRISTQADKYNECKIRIRSNSSRKLEHAGSRSRNISPALASAKNRNIQKMFDKVNKEEETGFMKLLQELY